LDPGGAVDAGGVGTRSDEGEGLVSADAARDGFHGTGDTLRGLFGAAIGGGLLEGGGEIGGIGVLRVAGDDDDGLGIGIDEVDAAGIAGDGFARVVDPAGGNGEVVAGGDVAI